MSRRPNVVLILADDMGYSDLGCFGGEIETPNLDRIGREGVRFTQFYNTARCSPSRASLLTGRHPHETGIGILTDDDRPHGYPGSLSPQFPTLAERLRADGYATCLSGKWHLSSNVVTPDDSWPTRRGFDEFYGILAGADDYFHPRGLWHNEDRQPVPTDPDYYFTDAISAHAADFVVGHADEPFLLYLAYTAPHWPLHAPEETIRGYQERYAAGWDELRERRRQRLVAQGLWPADAAASDRDPTQPAWEDVADPAWESRRMAVYAAQLEHLDRGVGRVLDALEATGALDETVIVFLSDNGACAEPLPPPDAVHFRERQPSHTPSGTPLQIGNDPSVVPGPDDTFASYGQAWANLSNTPFRLYKRWVHEGGIATPLLLRWPAGLSGGATVTAPFQLTDVLPTLLQATGVSDTAPGPGRSMLAAARGDHVTPHPLFWEHIGNRAVRAGSWKLVCEAGRPWELFDIDTDRAESRDLAGQHPEAVADLAARWQRWADQVGVLPWPMGGEPSNPSTSNESEPLG